MTNSYWGMIGSLDATREILRGTELWGVTDMNDRLSESFVRSTFRPVFDMNQFLDDCVFYEIRRELR